MRRVSCILDGVESDGCMCAAARATPLNSDILYARMLLYYSRCVTLRNAYACRALESNE